MFKSKSKKVVKQIKTIIDKFCVMRLAGDKITQGILRDIENSLGGIGQSLDSIDKLSYYTWSAKSKEYALKEKIKMIKGFVKPDGSVLAANMIVEGQNRTAAMMCYEMGLLVGVDENGALLKSEAGKPQVVKKMALEQVEVEPSEPPKSININDIPDEAPKDDLGQAEEVQHYCGVLNVKLNVTTSFIEKTPCGLPAKDVLWTNGISAVTCPDCKAKITEKLQTGAENHPGSGVSAEK